MNYIMFIVCLCWYMCCKKNLICSKMIDFEIVFDLYVIWCNMFR